ncbi:hypothetical protein P152DRAFT_287351 [Eremomyces bilateralis CBS 781.70]|uniref:Uncharacterized protein n=1 Tax=Eremomyces bilateralis CBS 781.70 TaxID=1392243 RepID=A0A6G1G740_9PEZI|nr:uncharacterized protein P152DRAFT_287351 [Eremomyces bilateralis CBS 781.70]KAF1813649.1 hypothetical protein P152DRAFT_287351 [Eremomyces bilateralis CBS 781.70]
MPPPMSTQPPASLDIPPTTRPTCPSSIPKAQRTYYNSNLRKPALAHAITEEHPSAQISNHFHFEVSGTTPVRRTDEADARKLGYYLTVPYLSLYSQDLSISQDSREVDQARIGRILD